MPMSAEECRAHAETCERMAKSLGSDNYGLRETMRDVAEQWRRLAKDAEARSAARPGSDLAHRNANSALGPAERSGSSARGVDESREIFYTITECKDHKGEPLVSHIDTAQTIATSVRSSP